MYLGAYAAYDQSSVETLTSAVAHFGEIAGHPPVWSIVFNEWPGTLRFPKEEALAVHKQGSTPFIRILPRSVDHQTNEQDPVVKLDLILKGDFDSQIHEWARSARDIGFPLLAEFGPEANGYWNQWSGVLYPNGPALYASVYRHIVDICRAEGVENVTWFFHMNGENNPARADNHMAQFYPGDDYIDWIGVSVLGAQQVTDYWDQFVDVMDRAYDEIELVSHTKPIALVETAVVEDPKSPNQKAQWLADAFAMIQTGRWPRLKAYSYWNEPPWLAQANDLRVDSSLASLEAFRAAIQGGLLLTTPRWVPRRRTTAEAASLFLARMKTRLVAGWEVARSWVGIQKAQASLNLNLR
jgi:hypothetical protein